MLGYSPDELRKIRYQDITPPKWHTLDVEVNRQVMTLGYSDEFEKEFIRRDGSVIPVSMRVWRIDDKAGSSIGTWTIIRDITERRTAERKLRTATERAMLYLDLMGHDICNQLQVISGNAAVLQNEIRVPETMRKLNGIIHSVGKCAAAISRVKLTEQLMTVPLEQRRLDKVLMACVSMLSTLNNDVTVETNIQKTDALVLADRFLEELLMILLKNAVEHNPRENRHVWVRLTEEAGGYGVSIADNGEGIADSRKVQLFDMTRRYGGVGLHLCKHILDKYGGRIEVSDREPSDSHQGLEVTVWLPGIE
jgi:two-component system sensor kinase FixL